MKLFMFPFAPNAAKVRLYLAEKKEGGCDIAASCGLEEVMVNLIEGGQKQSDYLLVNPFGAVPALELDDGSVLHESLAIIDYFEALFPEPPMWGTDPVSQAKARQVERIADIGVLIGVAREIHNTNSPLGLPANPPVAAHFRERWMEVVDFLENEMADGRPFLAGERVTVGDCTLQAILQFARLLEFDVLEGAPRLLEWCDNFRERPAAKATILR
jgi:glutathione S-transferase